MNTTNEDGWSSECPTEPGEYEFRCEDWTDRKVDSVQTIMESRGSLYVDKGLFAVPVEKWHKDATRPQWRPAKAVSDPPETDAAEYKGNTFANAPDDVMVVNSALARSLETRLADAEASIQADQRHHSTFREAIKMALDGGRAPTHHPDIGAPARKPMMPHERVSALSQERDAWKSLAGRLGDAGKEMVSLNEATGDPDEEITERMRGALAELRKLQGGEG